MVEDLLKKKIIDRINEIYPDIVEIRKQLHMYPELGGNEKNTNKFITDYLDKIGIKYENFIGGYGVVGIIEGKSKTPAVGIRADIDALPIDENVDVDYKSVIPGVMHACGHDIHTAILLGTATVLWDLRDNINGTIKLFFQPSEETTGGAENMINEGCLKNPEVSSVIGLHVDPMLDTGKVMFTPGPVNASVTTFRVRIIGKGCHGAHPDLGVDTIPIACSIISSLQTIISRQLPPVDSALITVATIQGGSTDNIISGETEFTGTVRTLSEKNRVLIKKNMTTMISNIAIANGATSEIEFEDSFPVLYNDEKLCDTVKDELVSVMGKDFVSNDSMVSLGADDFSYFCNNSRGLYINLGCHSACEDEYFPLHSNNFNPDILSIKYGMLTEIFSVLGIIDNNL